MLDLRTLRSFVAVAETENVGAAAQRLNMSSSPLSRQIIQLEAELGVVLFERSRQRLRLTRDGRELLRDARRLLAEAAMIESRTKRRGAGEGLHLVFGYVEGAVNAGVVPRVLRRLVARHPTVRVELRPGRSSDVVSMLRDRLIDAGWVYNPPSAPDEELTWREVHRERLLLAVPMDHPLAEADFVPDALDGQPWIATPVEVSPMLRERFMEVCRSVGFEPDVRIEAREPTVALGLVAAGVGLTFVQSSLRSMAPSGVTLLEVPWFPMGVRIHFVRRGADSRSFHADIDD